MDDAKRPRRLGRAALVLVLLVVAVYAAPALLDLGGPAEPAPASTRIAQGRSETAERPSQAPQEDAASPSDAEPSESPDAEDDDPIAGAEQLLSAPIVFDREADLRAGRIVIPKIGLDTTYGNGVHDAVLEAGPGHWPGTSAPGAPGNGVFSGHRTTWTHPFGDLDLLAPGDVVTAGLNSQPGTDYRVTETRIIPEAEYAAAVLAQPADPSARTITLFACHPKGQRTHRIVVTAAADPLPTAAGA